MDFSLNDDQRMLREMVERFAADRCDLASRPALEIDASGRDAGNWAMLADLGLLALPIAEEQGGLGGSPVDVMVVMEAVGRGLVAEPLLAEIMLGGLALARRGGDAALVSRVVAGEAHVALAWAERATRHRWDAPETRVSNGRLSGAKTFVLAGADTDAFVVLAAEDVGAPGLWLVRADAPGIDRRAYRVIDGGPAEEVRFDGVPAVALDAGHGDIAALFDDARIAAGAEMLGIMEMLFATTLDYLRTREQFGVAIGSFQAIQHRMADLYARLQQSRSILYRAVLTEGEGRGTAIAAASAYIGRAGIDLAEEAVQFHGGMGVSEETIVGHGLRRILLLAHLFGGPEDELQRYGRLAA